MSYKDFQKDQTIGGDLTISGELVSIDNAQFGKAIYNKVTTISGGYATTIYDNKVFCDGDFSLTLHDASTAYDYSNDTGQDITLNNIGTETVAIVGTIQGNINPNLFSGEVFNIISNGNGWYWSS